MGENLCDFGLEKEFLDTTEGLPIKEKTDNWTWSKLKTFALRKTLNRE